MIQGAPGASWIGGVRHHVGTKSVPLAWNDLLIGYQIALRNRLQLRHFSGLVPQRCQAWWPLSAQPASPQAKGGCR